MSSSTAGGLKKVLVYQINHTTYSKIILFCSLLRMKQASEKVILLLTQVIKNSSTLKRGFLDQCCEAVNWLRGG